MLPFMNENTCNIIYIAVIINDRPYTTQMICKVMLNIITIGRI